MFLLVKDQFNGNKFMILVILFSNPVCKRCHSMRVLRGSSDPICFYLNFVSMFCICRIAQKVVEKVQKIEGNKRNIMLFYCVCATCNLGICIILGPAITKAETLSSFIVNLICV